MISVVICSINNILAEQVKASIDETIGVPYELILIDNTILKKGIAQVYNAGAAQAKHNIICFVHEDVLFYTSSWGQIIVRYFQNDEQLGLVGVAGSKYKSRTLSHWWNGLPAMDCCNILNFDDEGKAFRIYANPDQAVKLQPVISLDGVFICARKKVWQTVPFNEKLIKGFHFYDIDISFSTSFHYKVAVSFEIDIVHLNRKGDFGNAWIKHAIEWHKHYQNKLPRVVVEKNEAPLVNRERLIYRNWLYRLRYETISFRNRLAVIFFSKHWLHFRSWPYIGVFIFYNSFKRGISFFKPRLKAESK